MQQFPITRTLETFFCWLKLESSWMSINCFHCFLPLSARESSLTVSLEEQRLAFVVRYLKLLILFDSMTNDKKFYKLTNPHSINIHFMIKRSHFKRQLFIFSADTYFSFLLVIPWQISHVLCFCTIKN